MAPGRTNDSGGQRRGTETRRRTRGRDPSIPKRPDSDMLEYPVLRMRPDFREPGF
ncbi:hypothetical protein HCTV-16_gp2 [Haloarcula virus HCTV-16]|nr:hypothetical protein HCTV-16_gp2 [Haloarcula virus HCTV-16]